VEEKVRTRFAPSPTGFLHLGGARTAIFNWAFARKTKGTFVLRIEDTDPLRSREEFVQAICEDLAWLGVDWDEGPDKGGPFGPYRQSERGAIYEEFLRKLQREGYVYPCYCTTEELEKEREEALEEGRPPRYSRRCLFLTPEERRALEREGRKPSWRFRVPPGRTVTVEDLVRGRVSFTTDALTDVVLVRSDGLPTYNFACVVDDALMRITHVLRGEEHLPNTPYQVLLYEALGFSPPLFAHVPIILSPDGAKLSKRYGDVSLRFFREEGFLEEALFNYLLTLGHSFPGEKEIFPREELVALFDLRRIGKSNAVFDIARLTWMNRVYLRELPLGVLRERVRAFAGAMWEAWEKTLGEERLLRLLALFQEEASTLKDLVRSLSLALGKTKAPAGENEALLPALSLVLSRIPEDAFADETRLREELRRAQKASGIPPRMFYRTLRVLLIGREEGPELHRLLWALGKRRVLESIEKFTQRVGSGHGDSTLQYSDP